MIKYTRVNLAGLINRSVQVKVGPILVNLSWMWVRR